VGKKVVILVPKRGEKRRLLELAKDNAQAALELAKLKKEFRKERIQKGLLELKDQLKLPVIPYRIEAFDISTIQGTASVGSMVVFENGESRNQDYRRFKIRSITGQDDFAMMGEVIKRRFFNQQQEKDIVGSKFGIKPDLVVVDGGKPQLSAALGALRELGMETIPVIALAKRNEEIYLPRCQHPLVLLRSSPGLKLIQAVRDEAHRFALRYHRSLRKKTSTISILDEIPGIGEKRKQILIRHFGSPRAIFGASLRQLMEVPHIPHKVAQDLYHYLHGSRRESNTVMKS
jgi:excinuclease ABC subunit C